MGQKRLCPTYQKFLSSCLHSYIFLCCFHEWDAAGDVYIDIIIISLWVSEAHVSPFLKTFSKKTKFEEKKHVQSAIFRESHKTVQLTAMMIMFTWIQFHTRKLKRRTTYLYARFVASGVILLAAAKRSRCNICFSALCTIHNSAQHDYYIFIHFIIVCVHPLKTWKQFECTLMKSKFYFGQKQLMRPTSKKSVKEPTQCSRSEQIELWQLRNDNDEWTAFEYFFALTCLHVYIHCHQISKMYSA